MKKFDVLVIGGGPGGYRSAFHLARQGKSVALFEKDKLGGSCLHRGCIPTKMMQVAANHYVTLIQESKDWGIEFDAVRLNFHAIIQRLQRTVSILERGIQSLLQTANVEIIHGEAMIREPHWVQCGLEDYQGEKLILATGSRPRQIPSWELSETVVTSDELLLKPKLPKSLLIIGGGIIGLEFACLYAHWGVPVRISEIAADLLPSQDAEVRQILLNALQKMGVVLELGVSSVHRQDEELVLIAIGRKTNIDLAGLQNLHLQINQERVTTNEYLQTSHPDVFAIGDLTTRYPYAHTAYEHARIVSQYLGGASNIKPLNDQIIPHVIFTSPEIASIGWTEFQARQTSHSVKIIKKNWAANSKARILGKIQGFSKVIYDGISGKILGCHLVGPSATDLIGEACVWMAKNLTIEEIQTVLHPHPTLSEIFDYQEQEM